MKYLLRFSLKRIYPHCASNNQYIFQIKFFILGVKKNLKTMPGITVENLRMGSYNNAKDTLKYPVLRNLRTMESCL